MTIYSSHEGYGNTSYSWTPPNGVDGLVASSDLLYAGPQGGLTTIHARYANHGATLATSVVLTATLAPELTYLGDTLGIPPTVMGDAVVWSLPDLHFLAGQHFALLVQLPAGVELGSRYSLVLTLASDGPEANPEDNTTLVEVMVVEQIFLPIVLQSR